MAICFIKSREDSGKIEGVDNLWALVILSELEGGLTARSKRVE